jgi:anthranilate synthase component 1
MHAEPDFDTFRRLYTKGKPQLVWTRLVADLETPVSAMLKLADGRPMSFLLESVEGGAARGRYSILGFAPDLIWRAHGNTCEINTNPQAKPDAFKPCPTGTLDGLRAILAESRLDVPEGLPPMAAGVFGYMGYDTVRLVERLPAEKPDPIGIPDGLFIRPSIVVVFDSVKDELIIVTPVRPKGKLTDKAAKTAYTAAINRLTSVIDGLDAPLPRSAALNGELRFDMPASNVSKAQYKKMVKRAKEYISAGDIFQVVLSQRFSAPFDLPPFALYRALRRVNPSPYLYFLNFGEFAIAGSSPEILVRVNDGEVTIRPIAGTSPRGRNAAEDKKFAAKLLADEKERAEHLMLVDLGRNDAGRVSETGTVKVTDSFFIEYFSHVMHIVSNVTGKLAADHDAISALMAGFPAGTVSGAPKVRAMEIIDELEPEKRGLYAGCVGYFSAGGNMDTCIVLRTSLIKDGKMHVQAGAGIVADSVPDNEQTECMNKAKALFRAAEEAVRFASQAGRGQ